MNRVRERLAEFLEDIGLIEVRKEKEEEELPKIEESDDVLFVSLRCCNCGKPCGYIPFNAYSDEFFCEPCGESELIDECE